MTDTVKAPQRVQCRRCHTAFDRPRRGAMPKYCPDCRAAAHRERVRNRAAEQRAELASKIETVRGILEPMRDYLTDGMIAQAEDYIASLAPDEPGGGIPLVEDRMPAGTSSPSGPDEGATSEFSDLRDELERLRLRAVMHDWHAENPGWWSD